MREREESEKEKEKRVTREATAGEESERGGSAAVRLYRKFSHCFVGEEREKCATVSSVETVSA